MYNESWPSINQCSILIIMWRNYKKKEKKKPLFEVEGVKAKKKPDLVNELDRIFSLFIRYRDTMPNGYFQCISCGKIKPFNKADCGHYINRQHMSTRFDEMNCNAQCSHCNRFMEGNIQDYRRRLVAKYGERNVLLLEAKKNVSKQFSDFQLEKLITHYKEEAKKLKEAKGL